MAGIFTKLKTVLEAEMFELVEGKEQKNPIALLNQYVREAEKEMAKAAKLVERQQLLLEEFKREWILTDEQAQKRGRQALLAEQAGETDLQTFAENEAQIYRGRADRIQQSIEVSQEQLILIEKKSEDMKHKLKEMQMCRLELMGRENVARANSGMNKFLEGKQGTSNPFARFNELEEYIDRLDKKVGERYEQSMMDARLAELERANKQIEKTAQ
jgi:phage shock protein A